MVYLRISQKDTPPQILILLLQNAQFGATFAEPIYKELDVAPTPANHVR